MTTSHTVEVTLCPDCIFDVGHECDVRECHNWQARMAIARRQTLRNMVLTAKDVERAREHLEQLGKKTTEAVAAVLNASNIVLGPTPEQQREWVRQQSLRVGK